MSADRSPTASALPYSTDVVPLLVRRFLAVSDERQLLPIERREVVVGDLAHLRLRVVRIERDVDAVDRRLAALDSGLRDLVEGPVDPDGVGPVEQFPSAASRGGAVVAGRRENPILLGTGFGGRRDLVGDVLVGRRLEVEDDVRVTASGDGDRKEGGSAREELAASHVGHEAEPP